MVRQLEVCDDLRLVHRQEKLDRFDLEDDPAVDDEIDLVARFKAYALVLQRKWTLILEGKAPERKLTA